MRKLTVNDMRMVDVFCAGVCGGSAGVYLVHNNTSAAILGVISMVLLLVVAAKRKA